MNNQIKEKLKELPDLPGVYIMRNSQKQGQKSPCNGKSHKSF